MKPFLSSTLLLLHTLHCNICHGFLLRNTNTYRRIVPRTSMAAKHEVPEHVLIAGGGIIGCATAYYLAKNFNIRSTIIDPTGTIAPAASGKAGGFLAKDWNDNSPTEQLTHRSFELHQELADTFGAESIQYRRLTCVAVAIANNRNVRPSGKKLQGIEWADQSAVSMRHLGAEDTIAQVHPKLLCQRLFQESKAELIQGKVVGAEYDAGGKLTGATLEDGTITKGDALLFACGPWSANIMYGVKYHSAIVPTSTVLNQCVFFSGHGDPEVYVRPDATAYCTGFPEATKRVTELPGQERVSQEKIDTILKAVRSASSSTSDATGGALSSEPIVKQACYLPTTQDGIPVMGKLESASSYIAAGHSCWGILLGPASGESMASLIATGKATRHVDLARFSPSRFRDLVPLHR